MEMPKSHCAKSDSQWLQLYEIITRHGLSYENSTRCLFDVRRPNKRSNTYCPKQLGRRWYRNWHKLSCKGRWNKLIRKSEKSLKSVSNDHAQPIHSVERPGRGSLTKTEPFVSRVPPIPGCRRPYSPQSLADPRARL
jgi:hypothetical protein